MSHQLADGREIRTLNVVKLRHLFGESELPACWTDEATRRASQGSGFER